MLKEKAIRKIMITTFSIFTVFVICIIPDKINSRNNYLNSDISVEFVSNTGTNEIYLLGPNNYLVKTNVVLNGKDLKDKVIDIINYLTIKKCEKIPNGLSGIIPSKTILKDVLIKDKIVTLDFSSDLLNTSIDLEERVIESIVYSIINLDNIAGVTIKIDGKNLTVLPQTLKKIPEVLTRDFGINKVIDIDNMNDIKRVTLYYVNKINNINYYVPVTKYLNDDREKINIIIDNLASNYVYESSLMSFLNQNTKLINYEIEDKKLTLNFNNYLFTNDKVLEEVSYTISESVCDSYNVDNVIFQVDGKNIDLISECNK